MRRLSHSQGLRQTLEWAVEARPHHVPVAHTFWHGPAKARPQLPAYGRDGLRSAVRQGLQVIIWAYQDLVDLPAGVQHKDAREWLPWPTFKACLQRGIPIVHIADHIRCKALSRSGGWFVDVDTLWLTSAIAHNGGIVPGSGGAAPPAEGIGPSCGLRGIHGHVFAPLRMRPDGRQSIRGHAFRSYLKEPLDRLAIATPFHVPYGSPILPGLVSMSQQIVEAPTPQPYNVFMQGVQAEVWTWGAGKCHSGAGRV